MTETKKPQLHQSHLQMLYRCGERFSRVVLNGEREPATTPLVVGSATHLTVARNLTHKIDQGTLLTKEAVQDFTRDDFLKTWNESPVVLNDQEKFQGLPVTRDKMQDQTIDLVTEHHYDVAPRIYPVDVEKKWVLEAQEYDYDMAGTIDVDEVKTYVPRESDQPVTVAGIRDTKTRKTNLGQKEVDTSEQYSFYALYKYIADGKMPDYVAQDNLIKPTKTQPARAITYYSKRTIDDFKVLYRRFDQANKIIKAGIFTPANPSDWWCSKEFCGFAADGSCPYFNSKTRSPIKKQHIQEVKDDGKPESIIDSLTVTIANESK